jgi:hypothetical protein
MLANLTSVIAINYEGSNLVVSSGNLLSFNNLILNSPGIVQFVIRNITLPSYTSTFGGFQIKTERNSYDMDLINNPFTITTIEGDLTVGITATSYEVGVVTDYQLIVVLANAGNVGDFLVV